MKKKSEGTMETEETGWTKADLQKLLAAMKDSIPNNKKMKSYVSGLKSLDWNKVAFPPFSPEACKQKWITMQENMRKIRTLTELIVEAEDVIANPGCNRTGEECTEDPPPKPPHTGYMLFVKEQMTCMTGTSRKNKLDVCGQRWQELSDTEKEKYRTDCTELNRQYRIKLNAYLKRFDIEEQQQILREKGIKTPKRRRDEGRTEDEEDPPPKPPQSGYVLFVKEQLMSMTGTSRKNKLDVCGQRWQDLSDTEKEKYRTDCTELNRQYRTKLKAYLKRFDIEEQQQILREKGIKTPKRRRDEECSEDEEDPPPKPPHTGYMLFVKEQMASMTGTSRKNKLDVCGQRWQDLSDTEKEKYRTDCTELNRQYRTKLKAYLKRFDIEEQQQILREKGIKTPKRRRDEECSEDEEDPPPKPPHTGYMLFVKEQMASMTGTSRKNKLDVCGQRWQDLSDTEKEKYRTDCTELNRQYRIKLNAYLKRFDIEEQQQILREKGIKTPKRRRGEERTEDEEDPPPKPPQTGYNMFCREQLACMTGISKRNEFNVCGKRWRKLSDTEKEKYRTNCTELNRQYRIKLNAYLKKFDIEEQQEILREKGIKTPKKHKDDLVEQLPGEPKRPPLSGNVIFCQKQMKLLKKTIPNPTQRFAKANKKWQNLSAKQKEHYKRKVDEKMEKYRMELQKWFETLSAAEQKNYLTRNPKNHQYLKAEEKKGFVNKPNLCQPSDSEDDDIEFSEEESYWYSEEDEDEDEEEEDEEDAMFEM